MTLPATLPDRDFFLMRHGQTESNARHLLSGLCDNSRLTPAAIMKLHILSKVFNEVAPAPTRIIHSGMIRTDHSTEIINTSTNLPVSVCEDLKEQYYGRWEFLPWSDVQEDFLSGRNPPEGEAHKDFHQRSMNGLSSCFNRYADDRLLFVAHGGTFYSIFNHYGITPRNQIGNGALYHFEPFKRKKRFPWKVTEYSADSQIGTRTKYRLKSRKVRI